MPKIKDATLVMDHLAADVWLLDGARQDEISEDEIKDWLNAANKNFLRIALPDISSTS